MDAGQNVLMSSMSWLKNLVRDDGASFTADSIRSIALGDSAFRLFTNGHEHKNFIEDIGVFIHSASIIKLSALRLRFPVTLLCSSQFSKSAVGASLQLTRSEFNEV